jgi:hypothetical protein
LKQPIGYSRPAKSRPDGANPLFSTPHARLNRPDSEASIVLKTASWLLPAALLLAGCLAPPAPVNAPSAPATTGQALAQMACPVRIAEAYAWVNHMPGPGRTARQLHVDVRLVEATDTAVFLRSDASRGDTLILEIRTAPTAPIPGRLAYREPVPDPLYKRVSFFCRGGEIFSLDRIERVY